VVVSVEPHRYGLGGMASVLLEGEGVELEVFTDLQSDLTVSGIDWSLMVPDVQVEAGDVFLQLTKFAAPCANIAGSFRDGDYSRVAQKLHPGWSRICARVVKAGVVRVGDTIRLQDQTRRA
jgi:MOSC domain-containing protein YiiM